MGDLVPVLCKKIVPSDEFRVSINAITRFAPLANPIYDRLRIDYDAFFVQNRIIDPQFKEFLTGGIGLYGEVSTEGMKSIQMSLGVLNEQKDVLRGLFGEYSLFNSLGLFIDFDKFEERSEFYVYACSYPILGYMKIYDDWYRNERYQASVYDEAMKHFDTSSRIIHFGAYEDAAPFASLIFQKRNYFKDPYTTALSEPLIGGPIPIMSGMAPVVSDIAVSSGSTFAPSSVDKPVRLSSGGQLSADLSSVVSNTVQQLNQMYALYKFFMKDTYNGNRYVEFVESHFGVRVPDSTLERPLFLGRYTQVAAFSEIFQTSGSTVHLGEGKNVLGDYAGKGVAAGSGFLFQEKFLEHGLLYVIMSIVPESTYFQGISDIFDIGDRFDTFYFPEFQNIGDVAIPTRRLYGFTDLMDSSGYDSVTVDVGSSKSIFGYQRRNWDLIWYGNELHGDFAKQKSMFNWTFARKFTSSPVVGDTFSRIPYINNPFTFTSTEAEPFYTDILFNIQALRPVERYESITTH